MTHRIASAKDVQALRGWLCAILAVALTALAAPDTARATDTAASLARLGALADADAGASVEVMLATVDRRATSDFEQGQSVAVALRSEAAGRVFGVLVDSHGVATLLGEDPQARGWLGDVDAGGELFTPAITAEHWQAGLPLGQAHVYVFVLDADTAAPLAALASNAEAGVVDEASLASLVDAIADGLSPDAPRSHTPVHFVHPKVAQTRSLGGGEPEGPRVVTSEEIVAFFTGPRTRAVTRPKLDVYIPFDFNDAGLNLAARSHVKEIGEALRDERLEGLHFVLAGHSDRRGSRAYNLALSERRAAAVRDTLTSEFGIDASRIAIEGHGADQPLDDSGTDEAYAANRRVELQLRRE